ncbi:MAG: [LysW]-aminoadipate kinase [Anaerolineae bacterium]|jgi:acetylglutamate/LysW-gamma-L-alpha-aminoadipate kinase
MAETLVVVKVGGSAGIDYDAVCADLAHLVQEGRRVILVHGGSAETNRVAEALGHPPEFITSESGFESRRTDRQTIEIFEMVYCGKMNKMIVEKLQGLGVNAVGLSGLDGRLLEGPRKKAIRAMSGGKRVLIRDDLSGKVEKINTGLLTLLLDAGYTPVVSPPAVSYENEAINVDGDRAAAAIAEAMGAEALVLLSNVPGLLRSFPDESSLIRNVDVADADEYLELAQGRMKVKVLGAVEAVRAGVGRVVLADARVGEPIRRALAGEGTTVA